MRVFYPYNEILPKRRAHDVYVYHNTRSLADEGLLVTLGVGRGSFSPEMLAEYYDAEGSRERFDVVEFPIVRSATPLRVTWNRIFFHACQRYIKKTRPDIVVCSVLKQGRYHFARKVPGVSYVYEVHELAWYPNTELEAVKKQFLIEKAVLSQADRLVVTTKALKEILVAAPYSLTVPIKVVPLGVSASPLPPPAATGKLPVLMYVGQLYIEQGVKTLVEAIAKVQGVELEFVGGSPADIDIVRQHAEQVGVADRIFFHGFHAPKDLAALVARADAFIAPFPEEGRKPYTAHTKLLEYARWGRPIIAPALSVVEEHFPSHKGGLLLFTPGSADSMAEQIAKLRDESVLRTLQKEIVAAGKHFSWSYRGSHYSKYLSTLAG